MNPKERKVLEDAALFYGSLPGYVQGERNKTEIARMLVALIDSLDDIEFGRSGTSIYDIIDSNLPGQRKRSILAIERKYNLTERESQIVRYLANDRSATYITNALEIAPATVKAHKYTIFKKLGIHSLEELHDLLQSHIEQHATKCEPHRCPLDPKSEQNGNTARTSR